MGIQVEFNPDLALRNIREHREGRRALEECILEHLVLGREYEFLKKGQRIYWLLGPVPLCETQGNGKLSPPIAAVHIIEPTHFLKGTDVYTRGRYRVVKIKDLNNPAPLFEGWELKY